MQPGRIEFFVSVPRCRLGQIGGSTSALGMRGLFAVMYGCLCQAEAASVLEVSEHSSWFVVRLGIVAGMSSAGVDRGCAGPRPVYRLEARLFAGA